MDKMKQPLVLLPSWPPSDSSDSLWEKVLRLPRVCSRNFVPKKISWDGDARMWDTQRKAKQRTWRNWPLLNGTPADPHENLHLSALWQRIHSFLPLPIGGCTAQHHSCSWKGLREQAGLGAMGQGLYCAGEGAMLLHIPRKKSQARQGNCWL